MLRFRNLSIQSKLRVLALASSVIALSLCCAGFVGNDVRMIKAAKVDECRALANTLGFNSTAVVSFHDAQAARELLQSLKSQPEIDYAALLDAQNNILAAYNRAPRQAGAVDEPPSAGGRPCGDGAGAAVHTGEAAEYSFTAAGSLEFRHPIIEDGSRVGTLFLCCDMSALQSQLWSYGKISLAVLLFSVAVVLFVTKWMQKAVARPVLALAETARRISEEGDYRVRSNWDSRDELGELHAAFNLMLDRIESSESELQKARDELEQRVADRTVELLGEIDQREKAQADLEQALDAAEAANRAKSEFLANMSHEIRTPLNAVLGFTDLLQTGGDDGDPAKRREYLGLIHTSGEHLLGLINDVLDLSKIESGRMEIERVSCSPQQIVADVVSVLRVRAAEKGVALEYRWESGVPQTVEADSHRLRQLLVNLAGNAIKFTDAGYVRIAGRCIRKDDRSFLVFDVIDTGVGIPREKWDDIFDPFVQADNSVTRQFGGTGLGLAISRRIVEAMGGTLTVQSEVGKGSVFTATIDVGQAAEGVVADATRSDIVPDAPRQPHKAPAAVPHGRVLVVEDGDTNRKLIDLILRRAGLTVVTAENGKLGVEAALAAPFDLILMDMQMPVMDGYTATATLREHGLQLPIVALTAHAMSGDEQKCRSAGCTGFITKPIHADSLLQSVAGTIAQWQAEGAGSREQGAGSNAQAAGSKPQEAGDTEHEVAEKVVEQSVQLPAPCAPLPALPADAIASSLPTDDEEFREIVAEFVDRMHEQLKAIQQALGRGDLDELARLAHWLKGAGGSAGFGVFTAPARHLEMVAKEERYDQIEQAVDDLLKISPRIVKPRKTPPGECQACYR